MFKKYFDLLIAEKLTVYKMGVISGIINGVVGDNPMGIGTGVDGVCIYHFRGNRFEARKIERRINEVYPGLKMLLGLSD